MVDANQLPVALDGETEILTPAGGLSDTGIADLAEKTEQDWRDEIETPFVTKTNPLLEWVNDLDVGALLSQIGVLQAIQAALDPLIDPLTVALLNANGDDQSTTITDQSSLLSDWSAAGNAKLVSAQKKFGTASIAFDGSGDYIYPSAASTNFAFGEGDFTIEMWVRSSNIAATQTLYDSGPTVQPRLQISASKLVYVVDGQVRIQGTTTLASNTWYHVAVCRDGDATRLFLNGQVEGLAWEDTTDYTNSSNRPRIGATVGGLDGMVGWIDSIRISKFARYDNDFPLPTAQPAQAVLTYLGEVFDDAFQVVFKIIAAGIDGLTTGLTTASVQAIIGGLQAIAAVGEGVWTVISDLVDVFITDNEIVAGLVTVFGDVISFFNNIITEFQNIPAWRDTLALVSNVITVINNITGGAFEVLELALDGLGDFFNGFLGEGSLLGQIVSQITGIAIDLITDPFDTLSNFFDTLPPLFDSVSVAILNANGANNSTTITDTSPLNANWTATGNVRISTDIKKYGTGSMLFDGSGDWISPTAAPSSFSWGNQNFTVEMWIYPNSLASTGTLYDSAGAVLKIEDNRLTYAVGGTNRIQGATTLNFNQWYHVAVCRSGVNTRLFLDGQLQGTWADSTVYTNTGVRVGATAAGTNGFSGHIDSLRLTKGLARYPGPFTPPSAEFPPAILNNLPFIGPIITAITDVTNGTLQDLVEFFGGVSSAAGSFIGQLVSGITGTAIELLTDPLGALNNWARGLDPVFQFFGDVIDAIVTALNTTLERVIDVVRAVVEFTIKLFTGFVNFGEMLDYLAKIFLSILAALGIVSGDDDQEFSLQYLLEGITSFFQQIPLIGPLITLMTGGARLNDQPITNLGQLGQWIAENMLRTDSALPARNLRGEFPWFLLPRFPIGHLDDVSPNLIEQNGFAAAAVMQEGGRWSWDGTVGEGAAKVTCTSSSATLYSNLIDVSKDQDLTLSVRVKWQGLAWNILASPVQIGLRTYLNGQIVSSNVMVANVPTINQVDRDFHVLEATWTVPAGVDKVRMSLGVTASASAGTVWFDDAQARKTNKLQQGLVGELVEAWNGLVDGLAGNQPGTSDLPRGSSAALYTPSSGVQSAAATATTTASSAATTATNAQNTTDAQARGGSNLVLSPTFADTTITRLPVSSTTQGYTTQVSRSGVRSWSWVQVPNVDCGLYLAGTQTVRTFVVKAGERYAVEAYLYANASVSGSVVFGAVFTRSGLAGSTSSVVTVSPPTAGQWTLLSTEVVVPAGYDLAEFLVVTNSPTAATFYLDDVTVREITNAAAAQSSANTAQSTANSASTAATNAQSTANNANTAAGNAQSTANSASTAATNAQTSANTAQSSANTAQSTANTAQSTANTASTTASNAQSTANSANTAASNAQNTANSANTAASNAQTSANTANTGVQDSRNALAVGLGGLLLGSTNATSSNVQSVGNTTRENVASLQAKIAALQSAAANAAYSGVAYSEDFSGYSAGALPFGKWGSVLYTSTGTNTGTVGIETTSGVPRAAWIGQSLDKRRGVVAYQSQLTSAYQKVGVVLSSTLNVGSKNYIYARGNAALGNAVTAELTVPGPFQLATVRILVGTTQVGSSTFTYSPGSTYWLECGYSTERRHRVLKDNLPILDASEPSALSTLTQRYTGFGLECNSDPVLFRWEPADVAAFAAYDNVPVATRGSGFRISRTSTVAQAISSGTRTTGVFDAAGPTVITADLTYNNVNQAVTVSVAGWYLVDVGLRLSAVISGNNTFAAACFRNGSVHGVGHQQWGTGISSFGRAAAGSWVVYCNIGDTLQAGYVASTNYSVVGTATGADTYFSIAFLSNTKPVNPPVT